MYLNVICSRKNHSNADLALQTTLVTSELNSGSSRKEEDGTRQETVAKSTTNNKKHLVFLFMYLSLFNDVRSCDVIVVAGYEKVSVRKNDKYEWTESSDFGLEEGQKMCVLDHLGRYVTVRAETVLLKTEYALMYYTSDFVDSGMKAKGECCELHEDHVPTRYIPSEKYISDIPISKSCERRAYEKLTAEEAKHEVKRIGYVGPGVWWGGKALNCVFFTPRQTIGALHGVYNLTGETRTAIFNVEGLHDSKELVLAEYDSQDLIKFPDPLKRRFDNCDDITLPIKLQNIVTEPSSPFLLNYSNEFYFIKNVSKPDEPQKGLFGDLQISSGDGKEKYFIPERIGCQQASDDYCNCDCSYDNPPSQSMISQFSKKRSEFKRLNNVVREEVNSSTVYTYDTDKPGRVNMQLGNWSYEESALIGNCDVRLSKSYESSSPNRSICLVLESHSMEREGWIPFQSNCSFGINSIKCDARRTELILHSNHSICWIYLPTLNKTILGQLLDSPLEKEKISLALETATTSCEQFVKVLTIRAITFLLVTSLILFTAFQLIKRLNSNHLQLPSVHSEPQTEPIVLTQSSLAALAASPTTPTVTASTENLIPEVGLRGDCAN